MNYAQTPGEIKLLENRSFSSTSLPQNKTKRDKRKPGDMHQISASKQTPREKKMVHLTFRNHAATRQNISGRNEAVLGGEAESIS